MRKNQIVCWIIASIVSLSSSTVLSAQEPNCAEIHAMARMVSAKSTTALTMWNHKAGDNYHAKVILAFRLFELHPADHRSASAILDLIPQNAEQDIVWHSLNYGLNCETKSEKDSLILEVLAADIPRDLARAVLLVPDKMLNYVSYAYTSAPDPNSDYAVRMQRVCRVKHSEFLKAVDQLPPDAKKGILSSIFNPNGCHALRFPEQ